MIPLYAIGETPPTEQLYRLHYGGTIDQDWWRLDVMQRSAFEDADHVLKSIDGKYRRRSSDECADIDYVGSALWAFAEAAWDWLPELEASGCRIAHKVRVERGKKQYKLVYCAPVLDLLDHDNTDFSWNDVTGTISWARDCHFYEWEGEPPLMFQVLFHHPKEYRGVKERPSMLCFASQLFVDEYERGSLTGLRFFRVPRTKRPPNKPEPKKVIVYRP